MFSITFCGCERKPRPLTDLSLKRISNSKYSRAYVAYPDGRQWALKNKEYATFRKMIRALSPIERSEVGSIEAPNFTLSYQAGMDPTTITVAVENQQLRFSLGKFVYHGGDAVAFESLAASGPD